MPAGYILYLSPMLAVVFSINICLVYLSLLDWYEREERVSEILRFSVVLGVILALAVPTIIIILNSQDMAYIYKELTLATFVLSLLTLYPFISWVRKKMYSYFYVGAYIAYDAILWYVFPLFFYGVMNLARNQVLIADYVAGAVLGTLIATAIMREIRTKEVILGSIPAVTTAITVADFSSRALSSVLPGIVNLGVFTINTVHIFLWISLIIQYFYYKRVVE